MMGNDLNIENKRLYLQSYKKKRKTTYGVWAFCFLGSFGFIVAAAVCMAIFDEFKSGFMFWFLIAFMCAWGIVIAFVVFDISRTTYCENGMLYSCSIFGRKIVKFESNMTVLLAPVSIACERKIVVKQNGEIVFKCSIGCFPDDKPVLIEDVQILKAICEKYDMEFINHWPEITY